MLYPFAKKLAYVNVQKRSKNGLLRVYAIGGMTFAKKKGETKKSLKRPYFFKFSAKS
jgi:hypothetical protein